MFSWYYYPLTHYDAPLVTFLSTVVLRHYDAVFGVRGC